MGKVISGLTGTVKTAKPGDAAARINKQPFDITKRTEESKQRAGSQFEAATGRQGAAVQESQALRQQLGATARGEGPSLAEAQMKQAQDRTLAQQLAAAASQRGGSPAALQRQLAMQQATSGQEIAQQAGVARMQESQAAQQQLGQMLTQEQAASDQAVNNYLRLGLDIEQARAAAQQDLEKLRQGAYQAQASNQLQANMANQQSRSQLIGGLLGAGGSVAGAAMMGSDKNIKKNMKNAKKDTASFLNALKAQKYDYKDESAPGTSPGKNYGIMAQDLEKSEMGKSLVVDTPTGKMVDTRRGFGAALAGMAELNDRTAKLEKALKTQKMKSKKSKKES